MIYECVVISKKREEHWRVNRSFWDYHKARFKPRSLRSPQQTFNFTMHLVSYFQECVLSNGRLIFSLEILVKPCRHSLTTVYRYCRQFKWICLFINSLQPIKKSRPTDDKKVQCKPFACLSKKQIFKGWVPGQFHKNAIQW